VTEPLTDEQTSTVHSAIALPAEFAPSRVFDTGSQVSDLVVPWGRPPREMALRQTRYGSVPGATSDVIYAEAAAGQTTLVNPVTLDGPPLASNTEYVYGKAAYCWGNGACGNDHKASADFSDGMTRDMQTSFVLPASWNSGAATTLDFYWFGAGD